MIEISTFLESVHGRIIVSYICLHLGLLLAAVSLWIVLPELSSSNITTLPVSLEGATAAAAHRGEALWAARAAGVRGDLWTESAFTFANLEWAGSRQAQT